MSAITHAPVSRRRSATLQYGGVLLVGVAVASFIATGPSNQSLSLATSAIVFGLGATGLGFLWGQAGEVNIAHAAVFGVGAYAAGIAFRHDIGFVPALGLSILAGTLAALVIALPSLRTRGHYFVILTFAIGQVAVVVATRLDGLTGGVDGLTVVPGKKEVFGLRLTDRQDYLVLVLGIAVVALLILLAVIRSRWGATLRGIRENESLAAAVGTAVVRHRILAFGVSGAIGGLAGQLQLYNVKFIDPGMFSVQSSIFFLLMVLLGGRRYLLGPAIGAAVYIFLPEFISLSPTRSQMLFGLILVVMILVLPQGLLSLPSRLAVLRNRWRDRGDTEAGPEPEPELDEVEPPAAESSPTHEAVTTR